MKAFCYPPLLALALCAQPAAAQFSPGNPLAGFARFESSETRRASSSDANWQNGNGDCRPIPAGGTLTIAELHGPGIITHFWNTIAHGRPLSPRLLTLRICWNRPKLAAGPHVLRCECQGKAEASKGFFFGLDSISALKRPYAPARRISICRRSNAEPMWSNGMK